VELFNEQAGSAFDLILPNVVSLKVVLISAPCMCNGCHSGKVLQSVDRCLVFVYWSNKNVNLL